MFYFKFNKRRKIFVKNYQNIGKRMINSKATCFIPLIQFILPLRSCDTWEK